MNQLEKVKWLDDFNKSLDGKNVEELKTLEQEVKKECEDTDKKVAETTYDLPKSNYKEVASAIRALLNKQSVQWQYTLGMVSMYDFWNPEVRPKKVTFPMLDSTLRTLGNGVQFSGYEEWAMVVAVNKYFEPIREKYMETTELVFDAAAKHNAILDKLKLFEPVGGEITEMDKGIQVKSE